MLNVTAVSKNFDGFMAVNGTDLSVDRGEVVAVIGPNGAGKTTLFNLITGQLTPDAGNILFKGRSISGQMPHEICKDGICRSYQVVNIFTRLTVFENVQIALLSQREKTLNMFSSAKLMAVNETMKIIESVGLKHKADSVSGSLSHGDQKVLEIAISLGSHPELLIMDEPTAGMSPEETTVTLNLMKKLSGDLGYTILFCEHDMDMVFAIANRIMVMQQGRSIIQDEPDTVRKSQVVQEAYLGGS